MPGTVTVALKWPTDIILRVFDMKDVQDPLPGGGTKTVQKAHPRQKTVTIKGYNERYRIDLPPAAKSGHYALTHNVDADFFAEWLKQNQDNDLVLNHLIFAHEKQENVRSMVRENEKRKSGVEPIDPQNLKAHNTKVQTYDKNAA